MKGHMQDGKFHPHTEYKGVRKSRDQQAKTQGVRLKRNNPRITFSLLDKTEHQLYKLRDELSDQQEQETWQEVNRLIDKIQNYKMRYYGGTGSSFDPERKARYVREVGNIVMVSPDNDNENYDSFRGKKLRIVNVTTSSDQHPAFDEGMTGEGLYDLETLDGELVGNALYDYELVDA